MQVMKGVSFLNWHCSAVSTDATVLVSGPPRSGTSLVAATLHAAGLHMGYGLNDAVYEDLVVAGLIAATVPRLQRLRLAGAARRYWRLGLRGVNVGALRHEIGRRNDLFHQWGLKRPNLVLSLGDEGIRLFRSPKLIIILRDPLVIAERIKLAEGMSAVDAINYVRWSTSAHLKAICRINCPVMLVSYDHAMGDQQKFRELLFAFCGLDIRAADDDRIRTAVENANHRYRSFAAAPIAGFIGSYSNGVLSGWCRIPGSLERATLQILVDGRHLLLTVADEFRADLAAVGLSDGRLGFAVDLTPYALSESSLIQAVVYSSGDELINSGRTLRDLSLLTR